MVYDKISLSIEKQNTTSLCFMSDLIMSTNIGIKYIATHPIIAKRKKKKRKSHLHHVSSPYNVNSYGFARPMRVWNHNS